MPTITSQFLTTNELELIRVGEVSLVDDGRSRVSDVRAVLRLMAIRLELNNCELNRIMRSSLRTMLHDQFAARVAADEGFLYHLALRAGISVLVTSPLAADPLSR